MAISGAMLVGLGFSPFYAAGICLMANTAPVAFGSIGIPVTTLAKITGMPVLPLSAMWASVRHDLASSSHDLIIVMAGWGRASKCFLRSWSAAISFAAVQFYVSNTMGPD